jgi:hypothetical protein
MRTLVLIAVLALSGCAGLGFNKQATLMPDTVGMYYETGPYGTKRSYDTIKIGTRADWKFNAPVLKEKK